MASEIDRLKIDSVILWALLAITLTVSPFLTLEPFNLPKLCVLIVFGCIASGLMISNYRLLNTRVPFKLKLTVAIFLFWLVINFGYWYGKNSGSIYGEDGRNTGYLAYIFLALILVAAVASTTNQLVDRFNLFFITIGSLLTVYGLFQSKNLDLFAYNNIYSSSTIGTFGNPNFMSAFLGIYGVYLFTIFFTKIRSKYSRYLILLGFILVILAIGGTKSIQGFLTLGIGIGASIIMLVYSSSRKKLAISLLFSYLSLAILFALGLLNLGPLGSYFSGSTLVYRRVYWDSALNMMQSHPIFGIGIDNFGEWFRRSRSISDSITFPELYTNAAHNVFLDLGAGGGAVLLLTYFLLNAFTVSSIIRHLRKSNNLSLTFIAISSSWIAYTAQSLISINQLGLAIWGWVLSGIIIGYEYNLSPATTKKLHKQSLRAEPKSEVAASQILYMILLGLIGFVIASPPYVAAMKYRTAIISADATKIQQSADLWPYEKSRFLQVIGILTNNNLNPQALTVANRAIKLFPNSFEIWESYSRISILNQEQKVIAQKEMERLDPHN
jgi:O-antigen ligase